MEPAAVLVAAFEIDIGRPGQAVAAVEHGEMAGAGIEPDVEDVGFLGNSVDAAFARTAHPGRSIRRPICRTRRRRYAREKIDHAVEDLAIGERLAALFAIENGDGHAPDALARDAPIGARGDHVGDALFAPVGHPLDVLDGVERALARSSLRSMPMNHCSVARKMVGLWQRQQCG